MVKRSTPWDSWAWLSRSSKQDTHSSALRHIALQQKDSQHQLFSPEKKSFAFGVYLS
jgi:hypothetical protein